jgi:nucleoside-diphosphate-sugar epimerase
MTEPFTIIGAGGFVGRNLARHLLDQGIPVEDVLREDIPYLEGQLGHVIYAVGLTADFRERPFETVDGHVSVLSTVLRRIRFKSFLYLSSTRVYAGAETTAENQPLSVQPSNPDHLYNISKLMGEALCLSHPNPRCRIARLSNVVGADDRSDNFLTSVVAEALQRGSVIFRTGASSARDFIDIEDVCRLLSMIATSGKERLYNVASGHNVTNGQLAQLVGQLARVRTEFALDALLVTYPAIDTKRIRQEFKFATSPFEASLRQIISARQQLVSPS